MSLQDRADYWAEHFGIPPELFRALVQQESGWNPSAVNSGSGAFGLTQAMPATASDPGFGVDPLTRRDDPDDQLRFGAQYLDAMLDRYGGDEEKALAAYNWGPGHADKWGGDYASLPAETRDYIAKIRGRRPGGADLTYGGDASYEPSSLPGIFPGPRTAEEMDDVPEYADNWLGRLAERRDTSRDAFQERFGLSDGTAKGMGNALQMLGLQLMYG